MRLICPNCGAQYEVPVDVVPEAGRDVQCSNCGHTWFQGHPDHEQSPAEDLNQPVPEAEWAIEPPAPPSDPQAAEAQPAETPPVQAKPRRIDPDMAELFREERDFEANLRAGDSLESQPDLGLQAPADNEQARRSRESREQMARMRGEDAAAPSAPVNEPAAAQGHALAQATAAAAAAGSRRDLLPDVEEINQTLRSSSEPRVIDTAKGQEFPTKPSKESSGFGKGFFTMVILAGVAIGVYAYAPQISQKLPQAQPVLETYVIKVDAARAWLDGQVTHLMTTLDGMSSEADTAPPASE